MMNAKLKDDLARLYAGMTSEQISAHEDWVRRYKATESYAAVQSDIEFNRRWRELRDLSDLELVREVLTIHPSPDDAERALRMLRNAGFERSER